jgi:hypothetical protein
MRCAHVPRQHQGCIQRRLEMVWIGTSTVGRKGRGPSPLDETETPSLLSCQCLFLPRANRADKGAMLVQQQRSPPRAVSAWTIVASLRPFLRAKPRPELPDRQRSLARRICVLACIVHLLSPASPAAAMTSEATGGSL